MVITTTNVHVSDSYLHFCPYFDIYNYSKSPHELKEPSDLRTYMYRLKFGFEIPKNIRTLAALKRKIGSYTKKHSHFDGQILDFNWVKKLRPKSHCVMFSLIYACLQLEICCP